MKRYYSTVKPYYIRRRFYPVRSIIAYIIGKFYRKSVKILFTEPLPENENIAILANHAGAYGPLLMHFNYPRKNRTWVNSKLVYSRLVPEQLKAEMTYGKKGIRKIISYALVYIIAPILAAGFRSIEAIPVYRDARIRTTFRKTNETLISGRDIIIFPESKVKSPNLQYVNKLQLGFVMTANAYYSETGRRLKFYPAYISKSLNTIIIGKPITYDPVNSSKDERLRITEYATQEIERLAGELPPHEPTPHGNLVLLDE